MHGALDTSHLHDKAHVLRPDYCKKGDQASLSVLKPIFAYLSVHKGIYGEEQSSASKFYINKIHILRGIGQQSLWTAMIVSFPVGDGLVPRQHSASFCARRKRRY